MDQKHVKMVFIEAQALHARTDARIDEHQILRRLHNRPFGQLDYTRDCNVVPEGPTTAGDSFYLWHSKEILYLLAFKRKVICWYLDHDTGRYQEIVQT